MAHSSKITGTADKGWFEYLSEHCLASSGWGGNLTGMRKLYWRNDPVIRCCNYLFRVDADTFYKVTGRKCGE